MPGYRADDGEPLHYDEVGSGGGAPLVVLAGGAARHPSYLGELAGLDAGRRLVVPHLRGVGRSPLPDDRERASFWRQADDVEALRVHLGLDRLGVVAHSAGTRLAVSYAARFPDRVGGMVLITPPAGYLVDVPSDVDALVDARRGEPAFDAAVVAWQAGPGSDTDEAFEAWLGVVAPLGYATWNDEAKAHAAVGRTSLAANTAFFSVAPPADLVERLAAVDAPVLVVAGAGDCIAGVAQPVALAARLRSGTAVTIDRCGHYPWVERPEAFRRAIDPAVVSAG